MEKIQILLKKKKKKLKYIGNKRSHKIYSVAIRSFLLQSAGVSMYWYIAEHFSGKVNMWKEPPGIDPVRSQNKLHHNVRRRSNAFDKISVICVTIKETLKQQPLWWCLPNTWLSPIKYMPLFTNFYRRKSTSEKLLRLWLSKCPNSPH